MSDQPDDTPPLTKATTLLFAFACGATTANVYYSQSIVGPISLSLHLPQTLAGVIVTTTQLGYGLELFFLVCLADLYENRRLVLITTAGAVLSLLGVACSTNAPNLLIASLALGVFTVGSQILLPLAVHLSPEKLRGQVIGQIMGGLVTGIMLSRPLASFLTAHFGWRAVFFVSSAVMLALLLLLVRSLPRWEPHPTRGYAATLLSTLNLVRTLRPLQRRAAYQGTIFAVFNLFWTAVPLMLHNRFGLGQAGIAAFALAGAAGACSAPFAGRVADRGGSQRGTGVVLFCAGVALLLTGAAESWDSMLLLVFAAVVLDASTQANQVFGQRVVQSLDPKARGRLNAAYMTILFICGAIGSALGSFSYSYGGWWLTASLGAAMMFVIVVVFLTELRAPRVA